MILTVTLNTALDRTISVPSFRIGQRHRAVESRLVAGGKGVNVARVLRKLGCPVLATGFIGGSVGGRIRSMLESEGVLSDFVGVEGESRINLTVVDPTTGTHTEVNERGPVVGEDDINRFVDRLDYLAPGVRFCVLAGSLPPGADVSTYALLVERLRGAGVPTLLYTDGEALRLGLRAGPAIVAPNQAEAEEAVGHEFTDEDERASGLAELIELGAREAIVTSAAGCVAVLDTGAGTMAGFRAGTDPLEPVARVGSGDAFVAGFAAARYAGRPAEECLAHGVACGAESTQHFGAGMIDSSEVERIVSRVTVEPFEALARVA